MRALAAAVLFTLGGASLAATPGDTPEEALAALQSAYATAVTPGEQAERYRELFAAVFARIQRSYATEVDLAALAAEARKAVGTGPAGSGEPAEVFRKAVNQALATLDPHSRYLDPRAHGNERSNVSGSFSGLGIEIEPDERGVRVLAAIPDSPASRADLRTGDLIVRVDDQPLLGLPLAEAIARMRGAPGTSVAVTIQRPGAPQAFTVSLTRETIRRQMLHWSMEGDVLVLRLRSFTGAVTSALQRAAAEATSAHAPRAVVLDMRGNPGGLLREAVHTADAFLAGGNIVSLSGRTPMPQFARQADAEELLAGLPMVVLIDGRSASAAELVAAALQENGRARVMGQRSFGKGSVQTTFSLGEDRGALKLTTAFYHGPTGRSVHKTGVAPDVELVGTAPEPRRYGDAGGLPAVLAADRTPAGAPRVEQDRCAALFKAADPALSCAVAYLRAANADDFFAATRGSPP